MLTLVHAMPCYREADKVTGNGVDGVDGGAQIGVDIDPAALEVAQENCDGFEDLYMDLVQSSVAGVEGLRLKADTVVMNPPFGTRREVRAWPAAVALSPAMPYSDGQRLRITCVLEIRLESTQGISKIGS